MSQFLTPPPLKNCKEEDQCWKPGGGALLRLGHSLAGVKKFGGAALCLRAEIWFSEKVDLGGYDFTTYSP